jgi:hypothetical protein
MKSIVIDLTSVYIMIQKIYIKYGKQHKNNIKLLLTFIFFIFLSFSVRSQTHLQLILNTDQPVDSAFIVHWTDREAIWLAFKDTLEINFKTRGIDFYHLNYIANGKNYFTSVFLDKGNIKIISHLDDKRIIVDSVTGSPIYTKYLQWRTEFNTLKLNKDSIALDLLLLKGYEDNIDNLISFNIGNRYLDIHQNDKLKLYALLPLIAKQAPAIKEHFGFSFMNDRLQGIIKNDVILFSDYPFIDIHNKVVYPSAIKAKFVILDFWFVGCLPCLEDHKKMIKFLPLLKQKQTEFISISNEDQYVKWKDYLDKYKFKWEHYKRVDGNNNMIEQLGISTYPTYILLDEKGRILYSSYSLEEVMKQLN